MTEDDSGAGQQQRRSLASLLSVAGGGSKPGGRLRPKTPSVVVTDETCSTTPLVRVIPNFFSYATGPFVNIERRGIGASSVNSEAPHYYLRGIDDC